MFRRHFWGLGGPLSLYVLSMNGMLKSYIHHSFEKQIRAQFMTHSVKKAEMLESRSQSHIAFTTPWGYSGLLRILTTPCC